MVDCFQLNTKTGFPLLFDQYAFVSHQWTRQNTDVLSFGKGSFNQNGFIQPQHPLYPLNLLARHRERPSTGSNKSDHFGKIFNRIQLVFVGIQKQVIGKKRKPDLLFLPVSPNPERSNRWKEYLIVQIRKCPVNDLFGMRAQVKNIPLFFL